MIERDWSQARIVDYIAALPLWAGRPTIEPLAGGMQNTSYVVTAAGRKYVARLGFDLPQLGSVESSVRASMRGAARLGVTPMLRYDEPHLTISDFIDGRTFGEDDIRDPETLSRIIALFKALHGGMAAVTEPVNVFWPFAAARNLAHYAQAAGAGEREDLPRLLGILDRLERAARPFLPAFTHNDAAYVNLMQDFSGRLWLIDWDYGGFGPPLWDVSEMLCWVCSDDELDRLGLDLYYGPLEPAESERLLREHRAFQLTSYLRQYFFCLVQMARASRRPEDMEKSMAHVFGAADARGYSAFRDIAKDRFERLWARIGGGF